MDESKNIRSPQIPFVLAHSQGGLFLGQYARIARIMLNTFMKESKNSEAQAPRKPGRGGARANAGRPKGTTDRVTIAGLLGAIEDTYGASYLEILAQDFAVDRQHDKNLTQKYHHLILNKVAATLTNVEVTETEDQVTAKALAFKEALAKLQALHEETK